MKPSPWQHLAAPDPDREYLALVSFLPLTRLMTTKEFLDWASKIRGQLAETPGVLGYSLRAHILRKRYWTLSAWEDEAALHAFVRTRPHRDTMAALSGSMREPKFHRFTVSGRQIPLDWEDALDRLA